MFVYDEFISKATLYFERAARESEDDEARGIWLLLGLEFLVRAPLARANPALLAHQNDESVLYAAGLVSVSDKIRSIPMSSVISRLAKMDTRFGSDRTKDLELLIGVRNSELHSSSAALASAPDSAWLPEFLNVVEAVCEHLQLEAADLVDEAILTAAGNFRDTRDRKVQSEVQSLVDAARALAKALTPDEIATRIKLPQPVLRSRRTACPVCKELAAWITMSPVRSEPPTFDDEQQLIIQRDVNVVETLHCNVCGIDLNTTAQVMAAGFDRLYVDEYSEDRYEGWRELMTYADAQEFIYAEGEYMDE